MKFSSESVDLAYQYQMVLLKLTTRGPQGRHGSENGASNFAPGRPLVKIFLFSDWNPIDHV